MDYKNTQSVAQLQRLIVRDIFLSSPKFFVVMKRFLPFFLLIICIGFGFQTAASPVPRNLLQQQGDEAFVKNELVAKDKWVPYPSYQDRKGWSDFLGKQQGDYIKNGEAYLNYKWQVITATDYLEYLRSGSRTIMETPFNQNLTAISNLFFAELAEGKGRFMDQLINGIYAACEMTTWAASAHLSLQQNNKGFPDHQQHTIDLVAGDVGAMLSWVYYFMHDALDKVNPVIAPRMEYELRRRILEPYQQRTDFWWMAFELRPSQLVNNWNPWCNSNVLLTAALIENDPAQLARIVYKTMRSVDKFINYNKDDGACEEGPSYWGHAAGKMYDYLQVLSDITGGAVSIFDQPIIKNMGEYIARSYVGDGWVVNFADASAKGGGDAGLIYRYGKAVQSPAMMQFAGYINQKASDKTPMKIKRDLYRVFQDIRFENALNAVPAKLPANAFSWYPQTEFCYMKNDNFFFAAKGGYNNESHNHNDVGTFSLYINAVPFFVDAGVGTYTRQTFSSERYQIWTMQSDYHNLPQINGAPQKYGARYKSSQVQFDEKKRRFTLNIANAYETAAAVKTWQRTYTLKNDELKIADVFELTAIKQPSKIHFLTWAKPEQGVAGKLLFEKENQKAALIYDPKIFDLKIENIPQDDNRLSAVWGPVLYRVALIVKNPVKKGHYEYTIRKQ